eukprot:g19125.t2
MSENRSDSAGAAVGRGPRPLLWLAALGAACAVAGPFLLSPLAVQVVGEGSVGVLRFGGRVLDKTKAPGFHFVVPFLYELAEVPVNVRTTELKAVPCGTSGGVLVHFPSVEIVHRLHPASVVSTIRAYEDYEWAWLVPRVKHDVNKLCARMSLTEIFTSSFDQLDEIIVANLKENASVWVPGLMIIAARVAKPVIPRQLQTDFVRVEEEISKLKVAHQHEQLVIRNAEMERSRQVMVAEKNREIGSMTMAREVEEKEADLQIQRIQDEMHVARSKEHSDAAGYSRLREAEGNERRLSPSFLELARQRALYQNLEVYYGDRMPEYIHYRQQQQQHSGEGSASGVSVSRGAAGVWRGVRATPRCDNDCTDPAQGQEIVQLLGTVLRAKRESHIKTWLAELKVQQAFVNTDTERLEQELGERQPTGGDVKDPTWLGMCAMFALVTEMFINNRMECHPNIARVIGVDDRDEKQVAVMYELADEGDFGSYAWGRESASMVTLLRLVSDMARGLQHLGFYGYSHNDIKPENVLIFKDDQGDLVAKIADLGCALAYGDMRGGQGTTGGLPPEAMLCREVPCEASQDVYALGHLILLTFTKHEWKGHNMWLSKAVRGNEDFRCTGTKGEQRKYLDKVTLRNQIDPRTRAVLLNPDHLVDELGKEVKELIIDLLVRALSPDPTQRPSMSEITSELAFMITSLIGNEAQAANQVEEAVAAAPATATAPAAVAAPTAVTAAIADVTAASLGAVSSRAMSPPATAAASVAGAAAASPTPGVRGDADGRAAPAPFPAIHEAVAEGGDGARPTEPEVVVVPAIFPLLQGVNAADGNSNGGDASGARDGSESRGLSSVSPPAHAAQSPSPVIAPTEHGSPPRSKDDFEGASGGSSLATQLPSSGAIAGGAVARLLGGNFEQAGGTALRHAGPRESRRIPRAVAMNFANSSHGHNVIVGGGGDGISGGEDRCPRCNAWPTGCMPGNTAARSNSAAGGGTGGRRRRRGATVGPGRGEAITRRGLLSITGTNRPSGTSGGLSRTFTPRQLRLRPPLVPLGRLVPVMERRPRRVIASPRPGPTVAPLLLLLPPVPPPAALFDRAAVFPGIQPVGQALHRGHRSSPPLIPSPPPPTMTLCPCEELAKFMATARGIRLDSRGPAWRSAVPPACSKFPPSSRATAPPAIAPLLGSWVARLLPPLAPSKSSFERGGLPCSVGAITGDGDWAACAGGDTEDSPRDSLPSLAPEASPPLLLPSAALTPCNNGNIAGTTTTSGSVGRAPSPPSATASWIAGKGAGAARPSASPLTPGVGEAAAAPATDAAAVAGGDIALEETAPNEAAVTSAMAAVTAVGAATAAGAVAVAGAAATASSTWLAAWASLPIKLVIMKASSEVISDMDGR